ncbi:hypothetical protein K435DRAFT_795035 [Dendrothele bispora CBS 962.96]|uniref:Uncharacterized protein n=1 Tax=Dendrothele bispora (strain CBS 962.96) TaxID=1314807 RepID=A0A4S8MA11_DENBC|nr:hypothetical protein K435DRAFT_795035 [Dendrothele bispora CBS 962.96]
MDIVTDSIPLARMLLHLSKAARNGLGASDQICSRSEVPVFIVTKFGMVAIAWVNHFLFSNGSERITTFVSPSPSSSLYVGVGDPNETFRVPAEYRRNLSLQIKLLAESSTVHPLKARLGHPKWFNKAVASAPAFTRPFPRPLTRPTGYISPQTVIMLIPLDAARVTVIPGTP